MGCPGSEEEPVLVLVLVLVLILVLVLLEVWQKGCLKTSLRKLLV